MSDELEISRFIVGPHTQNMFQLFVVIIGYSMCVKIQKEQQNKYSYGAPLALCFIFGYFIESREIDLKCEILLFKYTYYLKRKKRLFFADFTLSIEMC